MGHLLIDSGTKGFTELNSLAVTQIKDGGREIDTTQVSPALVKLLDALKEHGNHDGEPTEIFIAIRGKQEHAFTIVVDNLSEIQEILQWTVGQD